jgi:hypothetical protein
LVRGGAAVVVMGKTSDPSKFSRRKALQATFLQSGFS